MDFLTQLLAEYASLPEVQKFKSETVPKVEERIGMTLQSHLKFGEPDNLKPTQVLTLQSGRFSGAKYIGELNSEGQPSGRGIIFDIYGLVGLSNYDLDDIAPGSFISISDEEHGLRIEMGECCIDEYGNKQYKGKKFKRNGTVVTE